MSVDAAAARGGFKLTLTTDGRARLAEFRRRLKVRTLVDAFR